jgi:hypothetical protein
VLIAWRPDLRENRAHSSTAFRREYERLLLAFEEHLARGAPERAIKNTYGAKRGDKQAGSPPLVSSERRAGALPVYCHLDSH